MTFRLKLLLTGFMALVYSAAAQTPPADSIIIGLKEKPQRIVSLSPAATEMLFAAGCGAQTVARTSTCTYPPAAQKLPVVGGFDGKTFSIETILAFNPDFVYGSAGMHDYVRTALAPFGITVFLSAPQSVAEVIRELTAIGMLAAGGSEAAQTAVKKITWELSAVKTKLERRQFRQPLRVYWEIWNRPPMSAGKMSFINSIIEEAGGSNICASIQSAYPEVSAEFVVTQDPEVIIIPSDSFSGSAEAACASFAARSGWGAISAVKNGRVIIVDADLMSRCGPRIGEAVMYLSGKLYPDIWSGTTER